MTYEPFLPDVLAGSIEPGTSPGRLAVPTWVAKLRGLADWLPAATYGRDTVSLQSVQRPHAAFVSGGVALLSSTRNR